MLAKDSLPWDSLYVPKRCYGRVKEATSTKESNPLHPLTFWTRDNVRLFSICKGESGGREKAIKIFVVIHSFLGFLASYLHPSLFFKILFYFFLQWSWTGFCGLRRVVRTPDHLLILISQGNAWKSGEHFAGAGDTKKGLEKKTFDVPRGDNIKTIKWVALCSFKLLDAIHSGKFSFIHNFGKI